MHEFTVDAKAISNSRENEARTAVAKSYQAQIDDLEAKDTDLRKQAIEQFEAFLVKYPRSEYTPHVMFRLGELYFEESEEAWYVADQEFQRLSGEEGSVPPEPPSKDYSRSIALYERIIAEHPDYKFVDGCYYMLGFVNSELTSKQYDEEKGQAYFAGLVEKYPQSQFQADANMRLGEYYFDHNDFDAAITHYQAVVDGGKDGRLYDRGLYKLAWSYYKKSNYDRGLVLLTDLLDWSRDQFLDTGKESPMQPEAIEYTAISFSDLGDQLGRPPVQVAQDFYTKVGEREFEPDVYARLADVLTQQSRFDDAIEAYRLLQQRWPNAPENPTYQYKIAQLYVSLPIPDPEASNQAITDLADRYNDDGDWAKANRSNPDALATAKKYIEDSLASVATNYHQRAQQSGNPADYAKAAELYEQYLQKFPFTESYYEITWYLADTLMNSGKFPEALKHYDVLIHSTGHPYHDGALYQAMVARSNMLTAAYGAPPNRPPDAVEESRTTLPSGKAVVVYKLDDEHAQFIQVCDELMATHFEPGETAETLDKNRPALTYISGQILYNYGHYADARERLKKVIDTWPGRDEAAFAASLIIDSYLAEDDYANVRKYGGIYRSMKLGETATGQDKTLVFKDQQEGAAFKLALGLAEQQDHRAAATAFQDFMNEFPDSKYIKDAHYNAANNLELSGQVDAANVLFEKYVQKYPKDERSEVLLYRIAENYGNALELDRAISYYDTLAKNFPSSGNAKVAVYNAAFLNVGLGHNQLAAQRYQQYAQAYPSEPDSELVEFQAGAQWELVSKDKAIEFYNGFVNKYYVKRDPRMNADHVMEAYHQIAELMEKKGARQADVDRAWKNLKEAYISLAPTGKVGAPGRHYAAAAEWREVQADYAVFDKIQYTANEDKNAELLLTTKKNQVEDLLRRTTALVETYQDFDSSTAALFIQGKAYYRYAQMLYDAPCPAKFDADQCDFYRTQIDELRLPIEDKGRTRLLAALDKAKTEKHWSEWTTEAQNLLNEKFPQEFPKEKVEVQATGESNIVPSAPAIPVRTAASAAPADPTGANP